jgi:hypothetical protein
VSIRTRLVYHSRASSNPVIHWQMHFNNKALQSALPERKMAKDGEKKKGSTRSGGEKENRRSRKKGQACGASKRSSAKPPYQQPHGDNSYNVRDPNNPRPVVCFTPACILSETQLTNLPQYPDSGDEDAATSNDITTVTH